MTNKDRALLVADKAHSNQSYDIFPYGFHIRQVVKIAEEHGYDESIVVGAALHDTLEDSDLSYNDIRNYFGKEVAEIVYAVTDELGRNRMERKIKTYCKIKANWKAAVVKICDRIANMEHSKDYNPKMFIMYQKEFDEFKKNIHSDDHPAFEMTKIWERLEMLSNEQLKSK